MAFVGNSQPDKKILAQVRPVGTIPIAIYNLPVGKRFATIKSVTVANTLTIPVVYSIYLDADGAILNNDSIIIPEVTQAANSTQDFSVNWSFSDPLATLGVRVNSAPSITFTFFGEEENG